MTSYVIAAVGEWNKVIFSQFVEDMDEEWHLVCTPDELTESWLNEIQPEFIFFPHWRWKVSESITEKFNCVCFHMTDLPYGRGGSPLQNLILAGVKETKLTALRMTGEMDAGPIYGKLDLSLTGSAEDIYKRSSLLVCDLMHDILSHRPNAVPQEGEITYFKRRNPLQSRLPEQLNMEQLYDYIRMLDAPDYPKAFIDIPGWRLEFDNALQDGDKLVATVRFSPREGDIDG